MASSALRITLPQSFITVNQGTHGFAAGNIIRANSSPNVYAKAQANTADNAEVVGYVTQAVDGNNFRYVPSGLVTTGVPAGAVGATYFLSPTTAGALTVVEPTVPGHVSKPLLVVLESGSRGIFANMRGVVVSGTLGQMGVDLWTSSGTLALPNVGRYVQVDAGTVATVLTVPTDATANFIVGSNVMWEQYGAGQLSISAQSPTVTVNSRGGAYKAAGQNATGVLIKTAANRWNLAGDVIP